MSDEFFYVNRAIWDAHPFKGNGVLVGLMCWIADKGTHVIVHFDEMAEASGEHPRRLAKMLRLLEQTGHIMIVGSGGVRSIILTSDYFMAEGVWVSERGQFGEGGKGGSKWRGGPLPERIRRKIIDRDGEVCRYCGTTEGPFQIDHIKPVAKGGKDTEGNLCVACGPCNISKGAKTLKEWSGRA